MTFLSHAWYASFKEKAIPSLDGFRCISILLVIIGHSSIYFKDRLPVVADYFSNMQSTGVTTFFCLSGFLINLFLTNEKAKENHIDFKLFYLKRLLRIFPTFYLYLFFILIFTYGTPEAPTRLELISALTFTWNYVYATSAWLYGHSWSLSIEEQFYLTWPLLVGFFTLKTAKKSAIFLILISPVVRLGCYYLFPEWRGRISIMLHTRADSLAIGCLLSYYYVGGQGKFLFDQCLKYKLHWIAGFTVLIINPILRNHFQGAFQLPLGYSIDNFSIIILMITFIYMDHANLIYRFLNHPVTRHLGILSYGLYLWQQFFLDHTLNFGQLWLRIVGLYAVALCLNLFLEYPLSLASKRIQKKA